MRAFRIPLRLGPYLLMLGLGLLGNYFFTGEWLTRFNDIYNEVWTWRQTLALVLVLACVTLGVFCFRSKDEFTRDEVVFDSGDAKPGGFKEWPWLMPGVLCYVAAIILYLVGGENSLVRWLWFLSIILLVLPLVGRSRAHEFFSFHFWEYSLLALIATAAFTLRYVDLTSIPQHLANDVAIMGLKSRQMLEANDGRWVGMSQMSDHQVSEHQFLILSMRLFGVNHYGLTMLSVIAGTVSVVAVHGLGRLLFNRWVGLIAASFLAIEYTHIHFSRIIFGPITTCFVLLGALFLMHGIKYGSRLGFVLGGVGYGLGLLGYYSGRVGAVIVVTLAALWFWQRRRYPQVSASCWILLLMGILFTFGPNLIYGVKKFNQFNGRGNAVILWTPKAWAYSSELYNSNGDPVTVIKEQSRRALLTPFYFHDASSICALPRPMLSALVALFFAVGLGFCLRRFRQISCSLPLVWTGLTFLLGGVLTTDPPFWPHLNIAMPAIVLIAAAGAERFARRVILEGGRRMVAVIPLVLAVGILFTAINNWEIYHQLQKDAGNARSRAMRQIQEITRGVDYRVLFISRDIKWDHEIHRFFLSDVDGRDLSEAELYKQKPVIEKPTAFIVHQDTDYKKCVEYLTAAFPSSVRRAYHAKGTSFTIIRVFPPGYIEPPDEMPPLRLMWDSPGWRYVFAVVFGALCLGWVTLYQELNPKKRRRRTVSPDGFGA